MSQKLLITNCRLFDRPHDRKTFSILVENGTISRMGQADIAPDCNDVLDAGGRIIAPGFIDVHIQGAGGADILDGDEQALKKISQTCIRFGTTSFLATTVFKPKAQNHHIRLAASCTGRDLGGANLIGIHLEGPFISPKKKGMIQSECICPPSLEVLDEIINIANGCLKMMTLAPELTGCSQIIRRLVDSKIIAAFGHSDAGYEQTLAGIDAGISHVTHLFNAMAGFHHRSPGPLIAVLQTRHITAQIIPDGVHVHPSVVRFVFESIGPGRIIPITDGMKGLGLGDGKYVYNGIEYETTESIARYKDGTLIGTTLGLNQLLKRFRTFTGCSFETAVKTVTQNPAKLLGLEGRKGSLECGKDADLILLDSDCSIYATIVAGRIVYRK